MFWRSDYSQEVIKGELMVRGAGKELNSPGRKKGRAKEGD